MILFVCIVACFCDGKVYKKFNTFVYNNIIIFKHLFKSVMCFFFAFKIKLLIQINLKIYYHSS